MAELLTAYPRARAWFSFTLRDSEHLSDGTPLRDVVALLAGYPQVVALGINCIALEHHRCVAAFTRFNGAAAGGVSELGRALRCREQNRHHHGEHCAQLADYLPGGRPLARGLIGGCCRTTPADIAVKARS